MSPVNTVRYPRKLKITVEASDRDRGWSSLYGSGRGGGGAVWISKQDQRSGSKYYINTQTRKTTWDKPECDLPCHAMPCPPPAPSLPDTSSLLDTSIVTTPDSWFWDVLGQVC